MEEISTGMGYVNILLDPEQLHRELAESMERKIQVKIRPAPKWCPEWLWIRAAAKFIYLEHS